MDADSGGKKFMGGISLPAEVAPAMAAGAGSGIAELLAQSTAPAAPVAAPYVEPAAMPAAPVAAAQAPTAREMMNGVGRDGQVASLSQTPGYGMAPVYEEPQGRGPEREGEREREVAGGARA